MSNNKEERIYKDTVHMFLALQRMSKQGKKRCIRSVIKHNEEDDLKAFEGKIKVIGGEWRIYKTVNARCIDKAYKVFMKMMIDWPERASCIDSIWRTALLQRECKAEKYFMLDIDTEELKHLEKIEFLILANNGKVLKRVKSPSGWHYITEPFDVRQVQELNTDCIANRVGDAVTLLRDGYYYIKTVGEE